MVVLITVPLAQPHLGSGADGIGVAVALGVSTVSWVVYLLARRRPRAAIVVLSVTGVAGGVLAGLSPLSTAIAVGCVVTSTAGARLNPETSLAITAGTVAAAALRPPPRLSPGLPLRAGRQRRPLPGRAVGRARRGGRRPRLEGLHGQPHRGLKLDVPALGPVIG